MRAQRRDSEAGRELRSTLVAAQQPDGGWPYYRGRASRLEATCWAILALSADGQPDGGMAAARGRTFLQTLQQPGGLLKEPASPVANFAWNGLALLADTSFGDPVSGVWRNSLISALLHAKGIALDDDASPVRQNNRLQAWSWIDGTFSWIEPTAVCLLALKKARAQGASARTRIAEAEALVLDRVCEGGGWNYGNAQVLGQDLRPYVPTTALVVMAMQDRRDHPAVGASLDWLERHATSEPSTMALSLAAICLQVTGRIAEPARRALVEQSAATRSFGNLHVTAMALYALSAARGTANAFSM